MTPPDIRWIQRFNNFNKALSQLTKFIEKGELNELEKQGLIHSFECTYELAWNTLKDYFEDQGDTNLTDSRDAFRLAFKRGLIEDGETWMDMIKSISLTSHAYNEDIAEGIVADIVNRYFSEFMTLQAKMESFVITEYGRTVGRIVPTETLLDEKLATLQQAGLIRWSGKKLKPMKPLATLPEGRSLSDLIIEDRR